MKPSTMYAEATVAPVIESPPAGANTVNDMLLQSWGGVIRVFPAVPAAWADVTVHNVRAQGAFLVSARRTGGVTQFVRVVSLAGQPCLLRTDLTGTLTARSGTGRTVADRPGGRAHRGGGRPVPGRYLTGADDRAGGLRRAVPLGPAVAPATAAVAGPAVDRPAR